MNLGIPLKEAVGDGVWGSFPHSLQAKETQECNLDSFEHTRGSEPSERKAQISASLLNEQAAKDLGSIPWSISE